MAARSGIRFAAATSACASRCHDPTSGGVRSSASRRAGQRLRLVSCEAPIAERVDGRQHQVETRISERLGDRPAAIGRGLAPDPGTKRVVAHRVITIVERRANETRALFIGERRARAEERERAEAAEQRRVFTERRLDERGRRATPAAISAANDSRAIGSSSGTLMKGSSQRAPFFNRSSVSSESRPSLRFRLASASSPRAAVARGPLASSSIAARRPCAVSN